MLFAVEHAASSITANNAKYLRQGKHIQCASFRRGAGQVFHTCAPAVPSRLVIRVKVSADNRAWPAANSGKDRHVLLTIRSAICDRLTDDARTSLELPQKLAGPRV